MLCNQCGHVSKFKQSFCPQCGSESVTENTNINKVEVDTATQNTEAPKPSEQPTTKKWKFRTLLGFGVIIFVIITNVIVTLDNSAIDQNNAGVESFNLGDTDTAIKQLRAAADSALDDETKFDTLINLAYVYSQTEQTDNAISTFKEALPFAIPESVNYYTTAGEIATLEKKPMEMEANFQKAYAINPEHVLTNTALAILYLDLDGTAPDYIDYPKALKHAQAAYNKSNQDEIITSTEHLAIAHYFNSNFQETINLLTAPQITQDGFISYWIAWSYASLNDNANAKIYFQKAQDDGLQLEPEAQAYLQ